MTYKEWLSPDNLLKVSAWVRDGLTMAEVANNIGISETSMYNWQNEYPEFKEAIREGREVADIRVENALFKRCLGYDYEETITDKTMNDDGVEQIKATRVIRKHCAPDVGAIAFWLKNRRPDKWRERQVIDTNINNDINRNNLIEFLENVKNGKDQVRKDREEIQ